MKKFFVLIFSLGLIMTGHSQDVFKFAVHFTDKDNTPFSEDQPRDFLSQRSIDRRAKFNIPIIEQDLPIDPVYIQDVLGATADAKLIIQVKWMNAIVISLSDSSNIDIIDKLPHVEKTVLVYRPGIKTRFSQKLDFPINTDNVYPPLKSINEYDSSFYGGAWVQINQMKGEKLHELGFRGQGMVIAILDAGFTNVHERSIFQRLWENEQILGTKDMVSPGSSVFDDHYHGTAVLSTMGGYWEGTLVGTAPDADYWLIRTEDNVTEFLIEEYNWVAGAAFADSVGADVLNTSLGYTDFDDPSMNHTWEELNGDSTVITRGSNIAYSKGMIVVNSAGNSGNDSWRYIGAPADGYNVFSIGAINGDGVIAGFSSHGFPWSEDIKPNVVARGSGAYVASASSDLVGPGSGTSFSSPIMAGMTASLWSADPSLSPKMIKQAITYASDKYNQPDTLYGYGLPDFEMALSILGVGEEPQEKSFVSVAPNPVRDQFRILLNQQHSTLFSWKLYNAQSQLLESKAMQTPVNSTIIDINHYPSGIYFLEVRQAEQVSRVKITKL